MSNYPKIPDEQYKKAVGSLRLQLNDVFSVFGIYGQGIFIAGAIEETIELAEQFGQRIRGDDIPIKLRKQRNTRYER